MDSSSEQPPPSTPSPNPNRVQESPIFSYISNLSPIKPDKAALAVQGFPGINSPPFVLRSCQGKPKGMRSSLERADEPEMSNNDLSSSSRSRPYKALVTTNCVQEKSSSSSGNAEHLSAIDKMDGAANETLIIQSPPLVFEGDEDYDSSHTPSPIKSLESVKKSKPQDACLKFDLNSSGEDFLNYQHGGDVGQHQHGINRRLQFDEAHSEKMATYRFQLSGRRASYPRFTSGSAEAVVPESVSLHKPVSASNASIANVNQTLFCPQNDNVKVPKPSGIGLHLNSLIPKGRESALLVRGESRGSFDEPGVKSVCITSCSLPKNEAGDASISNNGDVCDVTTSIEVSASESPHDVKPLFQPLTVKLNIPHESNAKRKCSSETVDSSGDSVQSNPKRKSKIVMDANDRNGCKRCNCRKTKCLKLYCDCFAAGIYCSEPCACQDCFNRPEYENTVLKSRQLIESRDPLAFLPKVIENRNVSPTNVCTDDGGITLFSVRHKRGCNCKKSKCLKKYCECYQANVGCSDGCRCEGCENPHGQKEGYFTIKDLVGRQSRTRSLDHSLGVVPSECDFVQNEPHTPQNISPFQDPIGNEKDTSTTRVSCERYLESSNTDLSLFRPSEHSSVAATDSDNCDTILETNYEVMDLTPLNQGFTHGSNGPPTTFPHPQDRMPGTLRAQTLSENHISSESSLCRRRAPIYPSTHLGIGKLHEIAGSEDKNDTPEIMKEDPLPTNAVKLSSPNKKRVSPPRAGLLPLGSCSSTGLRTCRKFILKAIPPMRPRAPCIQSQASPDQGTANSQSSSSSK